MVNGKPETAKQFFDNTRGRPKPRLVGPPKRTRTKKPKIEAVLTKITVAMAYRLLEANTINRKLRQDHIERIADQIKRGLWQVNAETIKIGIDEGVLDGQHRLWACIMADTPITTLLATGIPREAFTTIDTIAKPRNAQDILTINNVDRFYREGATALTWLLRWQRGTLADFRKRQNRIENRDIQEGYAAHPGIIAACERTNIAKRICSTSLLGFFYYVFSNRNEEMAERFIDTMESPAGVHVQDPFFVLREWFINQKIEKKMRNPVVAVAVTFKAWNAAIDGRKIEALSWRNQGENPEKFPVLGG